MNIFYADSPIYNSYGLQDPASQWMLGIISLHDFIIFYLIIIATVVLWINISIFFNADYLCQLAHGNLTELIWTITPASILWIIGVPCLNLLYKMDEILDSEITVKAIGNQWFWSYEYSDYVTEEAETIAFDSFMIPDADLNPGDLRTLTVDNYLVLPANTNIRVLCTSKDVIHSFAIPSLGIKADCYPEYQWLGWGINDILSIGSKDENVGNSSPDITPCPSPEYSSTTFQPDIYQLNDLVKSPPFGNIMTTLFDRLMNQGGFTLDGAPMPRIQTLSEALHSQGLYIGQQKLNQEAVNINSLNWYTQEARSSLSGISLDVRMAHMEKYKIYYTRKRTPFIDNNTPVTDFYHYYIGNHSNL